MTKKPFFSIVMPTRNRGHLLRLALRSALAQTFQDYEIIVSDNGSRDDTADVVREFKDSRLTYVRTPKDFAMPDSWEFALTQARGHYVTYLCDDDAASPRLLEQLALEIDRHGADVITWERALYYHANWFEEERRNTLTILPMTYETKFLDSRTSLRQMFDELWPSFPVPKFLNCALSAKLIAKIKTKTPRFFLYTCPDISTAVLTLAEVESYLHIDRALMLAGSAKESAAAQSYDKRQTTYNFLKEMGDLKPFEETPLIALVNHNFISDTILRAKRVAGKSLEGFDINWVWYFATCFLALEIYEAQGVDVAAEKKQYQECLTQRDPNFQRAVKDKIRAQRTPLWRKAVRGAIYSNPVTKALLRKLKPRPESVVYRGESHGFTDIVECAKAMDPLLTRGPLVGSEPSSKIAA